MKNMRDLYISAAKQTTKENFSQRINKSTTEIYNKVKGHIYLGKRVSLKS